MPIPINEFPRVPCLNYEEARLQIRSGDILLCSGTSDFSQIIQGFTDSIWSHVGFILWNKEIDRLFVMESVEGIGVRMVPLSFYVSNYEGAEKSYPGRLLIARHEDFKRVHIRNLAKKAIDLIGYRYDGDEIARITLRIALSKIIKEKGENPVEHDSEYICSEYAYECFKSLGLYIHCDSRGFIAPVDFAKTKEVNAVFGILTNSA